MSYFSIHNHSHYSNLRLIDSINFPEQLVEYASEIGLSGISLTDHESLSGTVKFVKAYKKMKEQGKLKDSFKISFGNEIYLVKENNLDELKENYTNREQDTQFYHFLLTALDPVGFEQLKVLSSLAWENSFRTGFMLRVPTFKEDMRRIIKGGHVVATSACLGGFIPQMILRWQENEKLGNDELVTYYKKEIHEFILYCIEVFGKDKFFLEIQPSDDEQQHLVNKKLIELSKVYDLDYIVATDSHFLKKEDRHAHKVYLQSSQGDREVDDFYSSCYIFSEQEVVDSLKSHLSDEEIKTSLDNTMKIHEMIEVFDLHHETIIPHATIEEFELNHLFKPAYNKFVYIEKYAYSEYEIDRYLLYLIEEGFKEHYQSPELTKEKFYEIMDRINTELKELWLISDRLGDRMSSYYVLTRQIVLDVIWDKANSICGVARGSAAGYLINMLLNITQIDPLEYNLPHFRHLTAERPELPDIDLDSEQSKRSDIIKALKDTFGERRVLNIATFSREGSRSALLSACRGMGIDIDEASYLTNLIPSERGRTWTLSECFFGDGKKKKPVTELINAVNDYDGLMEIALKIENVIKNNSVHASGIYIFNDDYTKQNAMMKSSTGLETTQFDMADSDYMGSLKIDALTVQNIDKIRACMDMLIEDGYMEWQGSLRETYNKYLHPKVLEYDDPEMWKMVGENSIPDLFQFDTPVGLQTAQKIKPTNVVELGAANNLMRLMGDGIQPVDKYVMFRDNPELWLKEMKEYGLTDKEVEIIKDHLDQKYGVSDSQEEIMLLSMDERIANFSISEANNLRKAVAKIDADVLAKVKDLFFEKGLTNE